MQPGDLVKVYSIDYINSTDDGRQSYHDVDFVLGSLDGKGSDVQVPPGTLAVVVEVKEAPWLVRGEEIVILLVGGHMGWAYKVECRHPDEVIDLATVWG